MKEAILPPASLLGTKKAVFVLSCLLIFGLHSISSVLYVVSYVTAFPFPQGHQGGQNQFSKDKQAKIYNGIEVLNAG